MNNEIEAPEGFYFKGSYVSGFGLIYMSLYQKKPFGFRKKVAGAMTLLHQHDSGLDAVEYAKKATLTNWEERKKHLENMQEVRDNL